MERAFFSNIRAEILNCIEAAKSSISKAVCWFTDQTLFEALLHKLSNSVQVDLLIMNDFINNREDGLNFQMFIEKGGSLYFGNEDRLMHNKYCIIDKSTVITGSYNWTYSAEYRNLENIVIHTDNDELAAAFVMNFENLISSVTLQQEIKHLAKYQIGSTNHLSQSNYLAYDYFYKGVETGDKTLIDKSIEFTQTRENIFALARLKRIDIDKRVIASIGEEVYNQDFVIAIPAGATIPCEVKKIFQTVYDYQEACEVIIRIGESSWGPANISIGSFTINNLPKRKAGDVKFEATFSINRSGILFITQKVVGTYIRVIKEFNVQNWIE